MAPAVRDGVPRGWIAGDARVQSKDKDGAAWNGSRLGERGGGAGESAFGAEILAVGWEGRPALLEL